MILRNLNSKVFSGGLVGRPVEQPSADFVSANQFLPKLMGFQFKLPTFTPTLPLSVLLDLLVSSIAVGRYSEKILSAYKGFGPSVS